MTFAKLSSYLEQLEKTTLRNEITRVLSELFKEAEGEEIDKIVYLLLGQLAPTYKGIVFNLAEKMMVKIIAKAYDVDIDKVRSLYKERGDLGTVAEDFSKSKKQSSLEVGKVYDRLMEIANDSGEKSQERKIEMTAKLLSELDSLSVRYVARMPIGNLRLGFSYMTILDALSVMLCGDKSARGEIETAFNVNCDIGKISKIVKARGLSGLKNIKPEPGTPIRPSMAERLPSAEKILEKIGPKVAVEPKYDGLRLQLHINNNQIFMFSRNLESTTNMFPELVEAAKKINVKSAIFDGEAIAYDSKSDKFLPFQETVQRKRKHGIEDAIKKTPLKLFIFDILYKNAQSYLTLPFAERRKVLEKTIPKNSRSIELTRQNIVDKAKDIRDLIQKYLSEGLEGALVKKIDAVYRAGARGYHWVKYKKTTEEGAFDTIDCLVMGTYKGKGKRASFGVGAFLAGVRDKYNFKTTSKIGTGLTDEQWKELDVRVRRLELRDKPQEYIVDKNQVPDVWIRPSLVVEILADEITKSPIHSAGLALRFPRLIKFRDDKSPDQATSLKELEKLFQMQKV